MKSYTMSLLVFVAVAAALTSCSSGEKPTPASEKSVAVTTARPTLMQNDLLVVSGMVTSRQTAMISTRHMGTVEQVLVKQGDVVKAGQPLVIISSEELKARRTQTEAMVAEAQAATTNAERDAARFRNLHAQKSVSDKELENVELHLTSMRAKLQMARQGLREVKAMMAYTRLTAPFSGVVVQKMVDAGSMANPGQPLLVVEQTGDLQVTASLPETYLSAVKAGDAVQVELKALGRTVTGRVAELSPSAAMTGGQYAMKIHLSANDKEGLRAGMYAGVQISTGAKGAGGRRVFVDKNLIVERDQLTGVYVLSTDRRAMLRWVRLGKSMADRVEVLSGLKADEVLVRPEGQKLRNGQKVTINA